MAKKDIRTKYIKSLVSDKENLTKILEESTKESLDSILEDKLNQEIRTILNESDENSFEEEEVNPDESVLDTEAKETGDEDTVDSTSDEETDLESGDGEECQCEDGVCTCDTEGDNDVWSEVDDCKDEDGEYDLRGKDINTVLKVLQSMDPEDGVRIVKNDDGTATVEPDGEEEEFTIDIEDGESEPNEFETEIEISDSNDESDSYDDIEGDYDEDEINDIDLTDINFGDEDEEDEENNSDDDDVSFEVEFEDNDNDEEIMMNEGNVNLGYTSNYQGKTAMTMPSDKGEGEGDSRFDAGAPKGGKNNKKRWVGTDGANGGNPYSNKTKQPMSEELDECGEEMIFEVELDETHTRGMARKHNSVGRVEVPNTNVQSDEDDTRNIFVGAEQKRNTSRNTNEARIQSLKRQANAVLNENKELRQIAEQIKEKLNEAVVINSSLAKVIKLVTENSTTRDEKINILNRFNNVSSLKESKALYNQISNELKNAHAVNNNVLNNTLTEAKCQNKNMIVETNMLNQSEDLKEILDFNKRLSNIR